MDELIGQAVTHFFVGFGLALLNVIVCYFVPRMPRVISVSHWGFRPRVLILIYLISLAFQLITSPLFRSLLHSVYGELAWSPYQALFNVLGIIAMDVIVGLWAKTRQGAEAGRKQLDVVRAHAAERLEDLGVPVDATPEERAARLKANEEAEAQAQAERKQRIDDRLKDY
jgi:hypothetical protein